MPTLSTSHFLKLCLIVYHPLTTFITVGLTGKHASILGSKIRLCRRCGQASPFHRIVKNELPHFKMLNRLLRDIAYYHAIYCEMSSKAQSFNFLPV